MQKNVILFHLLCFLGVFTSVTLFLFYQVFVDSSFRKIPVTTFFKPEVFAKALKKIGPSESTFSKEKIYIQLDNGTIVNESGDSVVQVSPQSTTTLFTLHSKTYLTSVFQQSLVILDVDTKQKWELELEGTGSFSVLGWFDEKTVIVSQKEAEFSILKINLDVLTTEVVVSGIVYNGDTLLGAGTGTFTKIIYPDCSTKCYFIVFDLEKNIVVQRIPAYTEPSHAASLSDVKLLFFDIEKGFLAYEVPGSQEVFLIDHRLNFLQYIRLKNDRDTAHFISYLPQSQQLLFALQENDGSSQTVSLVAANTPSLHVLNTTKDLSTILSSPAAGVFQMGNSVYDLNGHLVKDNVAGKLLTTY